MSANLLLERLDKVRQTGRGSWMACCPSHADTSPSLSIRETDDGLILVHCFAGCDVSEVMAAAGLAMDALFPARTPHHGKPLRRAFPAADALRAIASEAMIVVSSGVTLLAGKPFSESDRERLVVAVARIQAAITASGVTPC